MAGKIACDGWNVAFGAPTLGIWSHYVESSWQSQMISTASQNIGSEKRRADMTCIILENVMQHNHFGGSAKISVLKETSDNEAFCGKSYRPAH